MDLKEICQKAETEKGISQNELAKRIGLNAQNLSAVLNRRRKLPAEAAIELSELTGIGAKTVWEAAKAWASHPAMRIALAMLAVGLLLWTGTAENADASILYVAAIKPQYQLWRFYCDVSGIFNRVSARAPEPRATPTAAPLSAPSSTS